MKNAEIEKIDDTQIIAEKLDQLIAAVLDTKVAPKLSIEHSLWNTSSVALYLGVSYKYASEYIVTEHSFPDATRIPTRHGQKGHPRWYAREVINWVSTHRR